jgi:hypothetical protein
MGKIEDEVAQLRKDVEKITTEFQKEIQVIHNVRKAMPLIKTLSGDIPVIHRMITTIPVIEREMAFMVCQMKAIVQYQLACANAAKKLASDLTKCKRLLDPPRRRNPR